MSNTNVGMVYDTIIQEVINSVRVDFEENGIEEGVLDELKKRWQIKLSQMSVAHFPWDPKPDVPAQAATTAASAVAAQAAPAPAASYTQSTLSPQVSAQPLSLPGNGVSHPNGLPVKQEPGIPRAEPTIKQEPGADGSGAQNIHPGYANQPRATMAAARAVQALSTKFGDQAAASISTIKQQHQQPQQPQQQQQQQQQPIQQQPAQPQQQYQPLQQQQAQQHAQHQIQQQQAQHQIQQQHAQQQQTQQQQHMQHPQQHQQYQQHPQALQQQHMQTLHQQQQAPRPGQVPQQLSPQQQQAQQYRQALQQRMQAQAQGQHIPPQNGLPQLDGPVDEAYEGILMQRDANGNPVEISRVEIDNLLHAQIAARAKQMEGGGLMLPLKQATKNRHLSSKRGTASGPAQFDGGDDDEKDEDLDDDAINSDLDDTDDDKDDDDEEDDGGHMMLCMYDKVQRVKNKWKCTLKDGVLTVNGKEYVFHKATGEYEW